MPLTNRQNPLVQTFRRVARGDHDLMLLDGWHLLRDASAAGVAIETVAVTDTTKSTEEQQLLSRLVHQSSVHLVAVTPVVMNVMSPVKTPSGVVALAKRPSISLTQLFTPHPPLILVAVDIQDPGNVGSLIRSAEAGGATGVIVAGDSADPWSWKTLRGAMGSSFRLPVYVERSATRACDSLNAAQIRLVATLPRGGQSMHEIDWTAGTAILLGSEGAGLSDDLVARADARVSIPMSAGIESLNIAVSAALLVYEARRQRN